MTKEIIDLSTGSRVRWNGKVLRVNNIWSTESGATARMTNAAKANKREKAEKKEKVNKSLPKWDAVEAGVYFRLQAPWEDKVNPTYARVRYILGVFPNTISFVEQWKSERYTGSFERSEDRVVFQDFLKDARVIGKEERDQVFKDCFKEQED